MRTLLKITTSFALALVLTVGMAFGQNNEADVGASGNNNTFDISQVGTNNSGSIGQTGGNYNALDLRQVGTENSARVETWGDKNEVDTRQDGSDNALYMNFRGTGPGPNGQASSVDLNDFFVRQDGSGNRLGGGINGDRNVGDIYQIGDDNELLGMQGGSPADRYDAAGVMVDGNGNDLFARQRGQSHMGALDITGNNNTVTLRQRGFSGTGNSAVISLSGNGNSSTVTQSP